jgi:hypothetical protein
VSPPAELNRIVLRLKFDGRNTGEIIERTARLLKSTGSM